MQKMRGSIQKIRYLVIKILSKENVEEGGDYLRNNIKTLGRRIEAFGAVQRIKIQMKKVHSKSYHCEISEHRDEEKILKSFERKTGHI